MTKKESVTEVSPGTKDHSESSSAVRILFISLGCDKNRVDAEKMLGLLTGEHFILTDDESQADVIIVNTCCFITPA